MAELHVIREKMMAEYGNDLHAFAAEMMRRQVASGRKLVKAQTGKPRTFRPSRTTAAVAIRPMHKAAK